jgi:hypothetical protein
MMAIVVSVDGARAARAEAWGAFTAPAQVGLDAAEQLLARGASDILSDVARAQGAVEGIQP